jgi:hypothetical protein
MLYKDSRNITHNTTVEQKGMIKNGQHTKRSSSQTGKRLTRPYRLTVPKHTTNARLPNNHKNTKKLRRLLRTKHHIPTTIHTRKERLRQQPMEHEQRKTKKNLQPNKRRTDNAELHRELAEPAMPENRDKQHTTNECRSVYSNAEPGEENSLHVDAGKITSTISTILLSCTAQN